ncbi:MAG: PAS domain S-box protein [Bacteroidales bacterium]
MKNLPNLLIVDDSPVNLALLEIVIKKMKVNLIQALSGFDALKKTSGIELALAIIDVRMPGMSGYELALKINAERTTNKVPVIFLTANNINESEVFEGYDNGAVDYIIKPVDNYILLSKINVFLDLFNHKQAIIRDAVLLKKSSDQLKKVNVALSKSEKKFKSYIDNAPDGVFIEDETGRYLEVNEAACRITGYSKEELLKMSISDLIPPSFQKEGLEHFSQLINTGSAKSNLQFKHKNGSIRWWSVDEVKLNEKRFLGFAKDITERKLAEEELKNSLEQLHQLTQYIEKVRENERVAISRELHDDLGQALTAVKIDLGTISRSITETAVITKINKVSVLVSDTIKTVQRLTSQLRPEIIDDLGIVAAIEWYTKDFAQRNGIEITLSLDPEITISPEASLIIFRIMQESLTNISRHSQAKIVNISLSQTADASSLKIRDNGIGISEIEIKSKKSFGIISMRERAASLGGSFNIYRENKNGTIIQLILPISKS